MASSSSMACFSFLMLLSMGFGLSSAAVITVGDAYGWTVGKIDYAVWATKKTFYVGDTLLFQYNNTFYNVMEVKKADYDSCNTKAPIATYTTGNDSITIKSAGDHFYIGGFPGHCVAGQKFKFTANGSSAAPSKAPAVAPSVSPAPGSSGGRPGTGGAPASPSEAPTTGSYGSPAPAPSAESSAVAYKGVGMAVSALAIAAGFMIMA